MIKSIKAIGSTSATSPLTPFSINRRELCADDVEIQILYCGICHSDLHQVKNDFGFTHYPVVPGHEIVGRVTAIGSDVTNFKVGDLAGIGCIVDSCGSCPACKSDLQQFCEEGTSLTFNTPDHHLGSMTFGGFSETYVCKDKYVLHIPKSLDLPSAAPLLCAGITVYSPLKHWNCDAGKTIGVVGIGGLGHLAIKMAKAMGAKVVVFTTSTSKAEDAKRLGAVDVELTADELKQIRSAIEAMTVQGHRYPEALQKRINR